MNEGDSGREQMETCLLERLISDEVLPEEGDVSVGTVKDATGDPCEATSATIGVVPNIAPSLRVERMRRVLCRLSRTLDVGGGAAVEISLGDRRLISSWD